MYQGQRRKSWSQQIFVLLSGCQHVSIQAIQYSPCKHKIHKRIGKIFGSEKLSNEISSFTDTLTLKLMFRWLSQKMNQARYQCPNNVVTHWSVLPTNEIQTHIAESTVQYLNSYLPSYAPTNNWWRNHSCTCISWSTNVSTSWLQEKKCTKLIL
jgi:hypothetical protein